jgi:hypothetical protein
LPLKAKSKMKRMDTFLPKKFCMVFSSILQNIS